MVSVFCRNCGKDLESNSKVCLSCGVAPPKGNKYCQNCGNEVSPLAELCVKCGVSLAHVSVKSKATSVILAVFFAYWTWLYTYKRDKKKFWIGLPVGIFSIAGLFCIPYALIPVSNLNFNAWFALYTILYIWLLLSWIVGFIIWILAIVDTVKKPQSWYDNY